MLDVSSLKNFMKTIYNFSSFIKFLFIFFFFYVMNVKSPWPLKFRAFLFLDFVEFRASSNNHEWISTRHRIA